MAKKQLPDAAYINKRLLYDPATGLLIWRAPPGLSDFADRVFNGKCLGKPAGNKTSRGYIRVAIDRKTYPAHCLIWKMVHGVDPITIDHINGDPSDNRLVNLRDVDQWENMKNKRINIRNTSGRTGVYYDEKNRRWRACISIAKRKVQLGAYPTFEEAVAVRMRAEREHGYHPNHGRAS